MTRRSNKNMDGLIVRFHFDDTTREEDGVLREWIMQSPDNRRYFNALRDTCLTTIPLRKIAIDAHALRYAPHRKSSSPSANPIVTAIPAPPEKKNTIPLWRHIGAAISAVAAVFALLMFLSRNADRDEILIFPREARMVEFVVNNGTTASTTMPDGTKIWVNAGSRISYDTEYNEKSRIVDLDGEAYFDVATNRSKPFVVKAREIEIIATGTSFNVSAYPGNKSIITTLVHGEITINGRNITEPIRVKPNQTVEYFTDNDSRTQLMKSVEMSAATASARNISLITTAPAIQIESNVEAMVCWKDNRWIVDGERLETFIPKLERRYNVSIYCTSNEIRNYRFNGAFEEETIEEVMKILGRALPLSYKIDKGNILLFADRNMQPAFNKAISETN